LKPPAPEPITSTVLLALFQSEGTVQVEPDVKNTLFGWFTTQLCNVLLPLKIPLAPQVRVSATELQL
jgi:hypothetical protein